MYAQELTKMGLRFAMEAGLTYVVYLWTLGTTWDFLPVLFALIIIIELICWTAQLRKFIDDDEWMLRRTSHGVATIAIAGLWLWYAGFVQGPSPSLNWLYLIALVVGLYLFFTGMQYAWGFPFRTEFFIRSLVKIALGVYLVASFDVVGHINDTTWYGWEVVIIRCYAIFCIATGITRLIITSGITRAILISYRRWRLRKKFKGDDDYGSGSLPEF